MAHPENQALTLKRECFFLCLRKHCENNGVQLGSPENQWGGVSVDICKSEQETQHTSSIHYIGQPQLPVRSAQFQLVSAANHFVAFLCSTLGNVINNQRHEASLRSAQPSRNSG